MPSQQSLVTISDLKNMEHDTFVSLFGSVYEHSEWIASLVFKDLCKGQGKDDPSVQNEEQVVQLFMDAIETHVRPYQDRALQLICEHPELAVRDPSSLTEDSKREQQGAGLSLESLSAEQQERFQHYNALYRQRFGMPFVTCVRNQPDKALGILSAFESRINNDKLTEINTALDEIKEIARYRIQDRLLHRD